MKLLLVIFALFSITNTYAANETNQNLALAEYNPTKNTILVFTSTPASYKIGNQLIYSFGNNRECFFEVTNISSNYLISSAKDCPYDGELKKGTLLTESLANQITPSTAVANQVIKAEETKLIQSSEFFETYKKSIEFSIFQVNGVHALIQSNDKVNDILLFKIKVNQTNVYTLPLEFRLLLENSNWGIQSDINFKNDKADVAIFKRLNQFSLGFGMLVQHKYAENYVEVNGTKLASSTETTQTQVAPYILLRGNFAEEKNYSVEYWGKFGVSFGKMETSTSKMSFTEFFANPGLNYFFKASPSVSFGAGAEIYFSGIRGTLESSSVSKDGYGTDFEYKLSLLKFRYNF